MAIILRTEKIVHPFIKKSLTSSINLSIKSGSFFCLLGGNGSGKTTLLDILSETKKPQSGKVLTKNSITTLSHGNGFCEDLSIKDHISLYGIKPQEFKKYNFSTTQPIRFFSRGQKRFIALLIIFLQNKKLWLLDEPFSNMDKEMIARCSAYIDEHIKNSGSIIFTANIEKDINAFKPWPIEIIKLS